MTNEFQNELYHYGIKGMKWGKRKARQPSKRKLRKMDAKWEKNARSTETSAELKRRANTTIDKRTSAFNKKYDFSRLEKDGRYLDKYFKDYDKMWDDIVNTTVKEMIGSNPSGTKKAIAYTDEMSHELIVDIVDRVK